MLYTLMKKEIICLRLYYTSVVSKVLPLKMAIWDYRKTRAYNPLIIWLCWL